MIASAFAALFLWRNSQLSKQKDEATAKLAQLEKELADSKQSVKQVTETQKQSTQMTASSDSVQPSAATLENIATAFTSKNTAALEGYMAPSVRVVYAASEMSKDLSPTAAVKAMDYVNSGAVGPWDFALNAATLAKYGSGDYKDYFKATTLVGRSSNGYVVAINFNSDAKINGIFASASDALL